MPRVLFPWKRTLSNHGLRANYVAPKISLPADHVGRPVAARRYIIDVTVLSVAGRLLNWTGAPLEVVACIAVTSCDELTFLHVGQGSHPT